MHVPELAGNTALVAGRLLAAADRGSPEEFRGEVRRACAVVERMSFEDERVELLGAVLQAARRFTPESHPVHLRLLRHLAATARA